MLSFLHIDISMTQNSDLRIDAIYQWLSQVLPVNQFHLEPASSDASFRRYFRVRHDHTSWIVMDAPPEHEDTTPFVRIATFLFQHQIHVPEILAENPEQGFLLLTDFGNTAYLDILNDDTVYSLYHAAIDSLLRLQRLPTSTLPLPHYSPDRLMQELQLFPDWFLKTHLSLTPPAFLSDLFERLIDNALTQPQYFVHRDYHSRNLMHTPTHSPGIIDFQDAVIGPISYDLVSLLRDCYIAWPEDIVMHFVEYYFIQAKNQAQLPDSVSLEQFIIWFDLMGLQRHLKVLGIFCRLNYRDHKPVYLKDLPLTMHYVKAISQRYPELHILHEYLSQLNTRVPQP